jgi:RimJ/RimL family protein N-acetyltransferase
MYAIWSRPDVVRLLYQEPQTREQTAEMVRLKAGRRVLRADGDYMNLAIDLRSTGELIGDSLLALHSVANRQGEIGFVLHPDHHGNGYATEASRSLLRIAFEELGLHRVIGQTEARNAASARVLEKLGMRREAHLVENEFVKGEWQSELIYAILDREWARS